jgi:hypothetical protein
MAEPLAEQETPELEVQAANAVAVEKQKAESEQENRQEVIDKLKVLDEKLDKIIKKQEEDSSSGGILGGIASALGGAAAGAGAASTAARVAGAALPVLGVAAAGAAGYVAGKGIDAGTEALTGRAASDWAASGVGAITGQNEEGNKAARAGESTFAETKKKKNEQLKGTGYEMVSPGKYKGPDGKIVSAEELPPEVQAKVGIKPTGTPATPIPEPTPAPSTPAATTPSVAPVAAVAAAGAVAVGANNEDIASQTPQSTQTQPTSTPQAAPIVAPVVSPPSSPSSQTTGVITSESKDKKQEQAITKLTSENEALKNEVKALRPRQKPKKPPPPPPPKPPKKEANKETTLIQIRNVEQSVATYTASIFDHPVVHPGIYKM